MSLPSTDSACVLHKSRKSLILLFSFPVTPVDMAECMNLPFCSQINKSRSSDATTSQMVPVAGVEPARYRYHGILSPARLPIPSHRQVTVGIILHRKCARKKNGIKAASQTCPVMFLPPHTVPDPEFFEAKSKCMLQCNQTGVRRCGNTLLTNAVCSCL